MSEIRAIFFGTSKFAVPALRILATSQTLKDAGIKLVSVITTPDTKAGRGLKLTPPPVKVEAEKLGIKILQPKDLEIGNWKLEIEQLNPAIIILAAYGKILPSWLINITKYGALNIHPSLLPKYRGATPLQSAILNGDAQTGVSLIQMDEKVDHGPIVNQEILEIAPDETYSSLEQKTAQLGAELLEKTLPDWINGKIKAVAQNDNKATMTKIIKKQDGNIDWSKSAKEIERQIRAFEQWPGSYCILNRANGKALTLKITKTNPLYQHHKSTHDPGKIIYVNEKIGVVTGDGILLIERVQPAGKKEMGIEEFIRGHKDFINAVLS